MITNRSVPTDSILPHVAYRSVEDAIAWLTKAFAFTEHYRYGESAAASGAQMRLGNVFIMVKRAKPGSSSPAHLGYGTQNLTIFIDQVEAHYQRAKSAGAEILEEPHETVYGEFQYAARDLDGHRWLFSRHARDLSPDEWGAVIASKLKHRTALLRRPRICYVEIPALDAHASAAFYEKVFGWNIRHRDTDRPSFDDATGDISGAWVTGRAASSSPGFLPYVWVDDINATLKQAEAHGAKTIEAAHPDHPGSTCSIATFHDPAGNLIGLYQESES